MEMTKEELIKFLKDKTNREVLDIYNELEYVERTSPKGKILWETAMRKSGMKIYKNTNRHLI